MPRRKSLIAQMYESHQKAKRQREKLEDQARRAWAAEERKAEAQVAREASQWRREEERAAQAKVREEQQAERAAAQQQRERERQAAAEAREQQRQEAERRRRVAEQRAAEVEFSTEAVRVELAAYEGLLVGRNRNLAERSRRAEDAFNADGPEAFVDEVQRGLATSVYPDGLDGSCGSVRAGVR